MRKTNMEEAKGFNDRFTQVLVFIYKKDDRVITPEGEGIVLEDMPFPLDLRDAINTQILVELDDGSTVLFNYEKVLIYSEDKTKQL